MALSSKITDVGWIVNLGRILFVSKRHYAESSEAMPVFSEAHKVSGAKALTSLLTILIHRLSGIHLSMPSDAYVPNPVRSCFLPTTKNVFSWYFGRFRLAVLIFAGIVAVSDRIARRRITCQPIMSIAAAR